MGRKQTRGSDEQDGSVRLESRASGGFVLPRGFANTASVQAGVDMGMMDAEPLICSSPTVLQRVLTVTWMNMMRVYKDEMGDANS